jgi:hypothetical protein
MAQLRDMSNELAVCPVPPHKASMRLAVAHRGIRIRLHKLPGREEIFAAMSKQSSSVGGGQIGGGIFRRCWEPFFGPGRENGIISNRSQPGTAKTYALHDYYGAPNAAVMDAMKKAYNSMDNTYYLSFPKKK